MRFLNTQLFDSFNISDIYFYFNNCKMELEGKKEKQNISAAAHS